MSEGNIPGIIPGGFILPCFAVVIGVTNAVQSKIGVYIVIAAGPDMGLSTNDFMLHRVHPVAGFRIGKITGIGGVPGIIRPGFTPVKTDIHSLKSSHPEGIAIGIDSLAMVIRIQQVERLVIGQDVCPGFSYIGAFQKKTGCGAAPDDSP